VAATVDADARDLARSTWSEVVGALAGAPGEAPVVDQLTPREVVLHEGGVDGPGVRPAPQDQGCLPALVPRVVGLQVGSGPHEIERAPPQHGFDRSLADEGKRTELVAHLVALEVDTPQLGDSSPESEEAAQLAHLHAAAPGYGDDVEPGGPGRQQGVHQHGRPVPEQVATGAYQGAVDVDVEDASVRQSGELGAGCRADGGGGQLGDRRPLPHLHDLRLAPGSREDGE